MILNFTIDFNLLAVVRVDDFPRCAIDHPAIGMFDLVTVFKRLAEKPELVIDPVTDGRQIERRHRIEETSGESAEPPVAQSHIIFGPTHGFPIHAEFFQRLASVIMFTRILQRADQQTPHQVFQ